MIYKSQYPFIAFAIHSRDTVMVGRIFFCGLIHIKTVCSRRILAHIVKISIYISGTVYIIPSQVAFCIGGPLQGDIGCGRGCGNFLNAHRLAGLVVVVGAHISNGAVRISGVWVACVNAA